MARSHGVFTIKRNDTSRAIKWYPKANTPSDFTDAIVVFNMRPKGGGSAKISRGEATIASDPGGTHFIYDWSAPDTNTKGQFDAEFEVKLSSGKVETYPNDGYITVNVVEDLG